MKKIYTIFSLLLTSLAFSQATDLYISKYGEGSSNNKFLEIYNGTNADIDLSGYSIEMYANGASTATNTHTFTAGTMLVKGDVYVIRNGSSTIPAIAAAADATSTVCNYNGDDAIALKKAGTIIDVFGQIGTDPGTGWAVAGIANQTVDKTLIRKTSICSPNATNLSSFGTNSSNTEWDIFTIDTTTGLGTFAGCSVSPSIQITAPGNNITLSPETTNVDITLLVANFNVANGTGDGHIHYTVNSGSVVMKYDTTPISIPTTPGTYTVNVELVNNSHASLSPAKTASVTFTVASYTTVADLAALRADVVANGHGKYYEVQSAPITTFTRTNRNQKYIQDNTGGILVDDNAGILNGLAIVETESISGLKGQSVNFSNVLQLSPTTATGVIKTANAPVTPENVTIAAYNAAPENYESELINLGNVSFAPANVGTNFAINTNYTINQNTDTLVFRTLFSEADYIGTQIPGTADLIVLGADFTSSEQVVVRKLADMTNLSNDKFDEIAGLSIYPMPATTELNISSARGAEKQVQLFDVLGKVTLTAKVTNQPINISSLAKGIYMVKITEEGKVATRKIVVQ